MTAALMASRLHVISGDSLVLRGEVLTPLLAGWSGPVKRVNDPADLQRIIMDLDTASLFDEPSLWVIRCEAKYLLKHAESLLPLATVGASGIGMMVLLVSDNERGGKAGEPLPRLRKALEALGAWHVTEAPDPKEALAWLMARLTSLPQGVEHPRQVGEALLDHLGADPDALLAAIAVAGVYADGGPLTPQAVEAVVGGNASRPIWDFTGAFLEGNGRRTIELLHAGEGMEPQRALAALAGEIRKLLACCETADDGEVAKWIGARGRPNLYYARQRARNLGKPALQRLLTGCIQAQRHLRQSGGGSHELTIETLVLHAQRVIRPGGR